MRRQLYRFSPEKAQSAQKKTGFSKEQVLCAELNMVALQPRFGARVLKRTLLIIYRNSNIQKGV